MALLDYQHEPYRLLKNHLKDESMALIVMATGLGKTWLVAHFVRDELIMHGRGLVLCHDINILEQDLAVFREILGQKVSFGIFNGDTKDCDEVNILFATFQTFTEWKQVFFKNEFHFVIVDEAHHSEANTFKPVIEYFEPNVLIGMTATPDRMDDRDIRKTFGDAVVEMGLEEGIAKGWLTPVEYHLLSDHINGRIVNKMLSEIRDGGEKVSIKQLNQILFIERRDEEIARIMLEHGNHGLVFCTNVQHADTFVRFLPNAATMHSKNTTDENDRVLREFKEGALQFLVAVDMLNEGIDIPHVGLVVFLRPTDSKTIFFQQLGRGLRRMKGKEKVTVLDFAGNCDRVAMVRQLVDLIRDFSEQGLAEYDHGPFFLKGKGFEFIFDDTMQNLSELLFLMSQKRFISEFPHLLSEFDEVANAPLTADMIQAGTGKKVKWKCKKGHTWEAAGVTRLKGHGCAACLGMVATSENNMAVTHPHLVSEFDFEANAPLTPEVIVASTEKVLAWKCAKCAHRWKTTGYHRATRGSRCPVCMHRAVTKANCLATTHPFLAREFDIAKNAPLTPETVVAGTNRSLKWRCKKGHVWEATGYNRLRGHGCPKCNNRILSDTNNLAVVYPHLAKEFHPTKNYPRTPETTCIGVDETLFWKCGTCGYEWRARIRDRARRGRCMGCLKKVVTKTNNMAMTHPQLAKEFDLIKNAPLTPKDVLAGTEKKMWWICKQCGKSWDARGASRVKGCGCPGECRIKKMLENRKKNRETRRLSL